MNEYKIVENKYKNLKSVEMVFTKNNGLYVGTDIIKYPFKCSQTHFRRCIYELQINK